MDMLTIEEREALAANKANLRRIADELHNANKLALLKIILETPLLRGEVFPKSVTESLNSLYKEYNLVE